MGKDKITIQEFATILAEKTGFTKQIAERFCKGLFSTVEEVLLVRDTLKINGLGTFKTQFVEPRRSINISTGEEMLIEGYTKVVFIPEKSLKELVNQPFAHLSPVELEDGDEQFVNFEKNKFEENIDSDKSQNETFVEPLKVLEEQAVEIKNILDEINGISTKSTVSEISENTHRDELQERKTSLVEGKYSPFYNNEKSYSVENKEVPNDSNLYYDEEKSTETANKKSGLWWKILLPVLLILALILVFFFVPQVNTKVNNIFGEINKPKIQVDTIRARDLLKMNQIDSLKNDSIAANKDSVALPKTDSISGIKQTPQTPIKQNPAQQTPDYNTIKATETVGNGTTLATLARKYYGHPDYWVYIFQANKNAIKNPDNLEIGTKINIPQLDKNFIDLQNPETLKKAKQMGKDIRK